MKYFSSDFKYDKKLKKKGSGVMHGEIESKPLIYTKYLNWYYGNNHILRDIHLKFQKGEFITILGPNGSGKTTLLRNITTALKPGKGTVFLKGRDILSYSNRELARNMAVVPQNTHIDFEFSILDIVLMGRQVYLERFEDEGPEDMEVARRAMEYTNTWDLRDRPVTQLSGGEMQRVLIARALAQEADVLIMDEPVSHLDIYHQIEILNLIKMLQVKEKLTVISVLHDLNLASQYSDHIVLLKDGYVKSKGSPYEVITEKNIEDVYGVEVCMIKHPRTGLSYVIPVNDTNQRLKDHKDIKSMARFNLIK